MSIPMTCDDARTHLLDYQRGKLDARRHGEILAHLEGCSDCAREDAAEQALTEVLERRLPQHPASIGLKRRLSAQWPAPPPAPRGWWRAWTPRLVPALAVALVLLAIVPLYTLRSGRGTGGLIDEAVNDHLRVLSSGNPFDIRSGGIHQVKPWFEGRLDFAPVVRFGGDEEFPLKGGAIGYFLDRKAAVFVFQRRLHVITLMVFRADGLVWPTRAPDRIGSAAAYTTSARGFNVILWRVGELGYALVSDVDAAELRALAAKLAPQT